MNQQGRQANITGRNLENQIKQNILSKGYEEIKNKEFINMNFLSEKVFSHHCFIGNSIYDTKLYVDFLLYHREKHPNKLAIEIKWQQVSGSVDEKFPLGFTTILSTFCSLKTETKTSLFSFHGCSCFGEMISIFIKFFNA